MARELGQWAGACPPRPPFALTRSPFVERMDVDSCAPSSSASPLNDCVRLRSRWRRVSTS